MKLKDEKEEAKGTTKKEWEEKGTYLVLKIDTVQKHKVRDTSP